MQALLPLQIVQHANSAVPQGTQQTQECQLQAIGELIDVCLHQLKQAAQPM